MGSSPAPFFPTTMVPPPPCGCGAPLYAPCSFSPAFTYPPTPFPGGYYPSPFPFYGVPSAFPYAASYPHPPPATSYTAATGSSPTSAYDLSTLPSTANSYPTAFSSFPSVSSYQTHQATIPNQIGLKAQPEATSLPTPALPESTARPAADSFSQGHQTSSAPKDVSQFPARASRPPATGRTSRRRRSRPHADGDHTRELCPPQSHTSSKNSMHQPPTTSPRSPRSGESSLLELPDVASLFGLPGAYGSALKEMETVRSASTTQQNKQNTSSAASMRRSFSGTTSGSSASSDVPAPTPLFGFTSSSVSAATSTTSSQCSSAPSIFSAATEYVAPQVFGEMPTPLSEYENYCCGSPNKIQSSCVQGGSNNPYEHDLDGQPHHYGLDNLKRQTVIRADGAEHSFYGLPENYLLDRATLGPLFDAYDDDTDGCSTELVDVFLGTPEQQKSDQFANCFCEALNAFSKDTPERVSHAYDVNTKGRTDESVHVFVSPPEQQPYEGEQQESGQLPKCFSKASEIVLPFQQPPMSAAATDQMQFQASKSMPNYDVYEKEDSTCINIISGVRDFTIELQQQNDERACHCPVMKASDSLVTRSSQLSVDHSMSKLRLLWDPGDTNFLKSLCATTAVQMTNYMQFIASNGINHVRHATVFIMQRAAHLSQEVHIQQLRDPSFKMLVTRECRKEWDLGDNTILSSALNRGILVVPQTSMLTTSGIFTLPYVLTMRVQFGVFTCVPKQSCYCCYCRVPASHENHEVQFLWDPGILNQMDTRLEETAVANPVHSMQTLFKLLFFIEQPVGLKFWTQLCHSWCTTPVFLQELHVPMIKTNNCSSTSIGVASSEYTYILIFLHDQWKFVRQGVHETDRAKHLLLSSPIYLQNREMNIFFITFLPP